MKSKRAMSGFNAKRTRRAAFTLVEVLAALLFMAIVIPVAMQAIRIANRAGVMSQRKAVATRIAERMLNEMIVTSQYQGTSLKGVINEAQQQYEWIMRTEPWTEDAMLMVSIEVDYPVQGEQFTVRLSTLVDNTTTTNSMGSTSTSMTQ